MSSIDRNQDRITESEDLDGLDDDETILRSDEERAKQALRVTLIASGLILLMILAVWFLRPEGQIMVEHWPNGYSKTETTYRTSGRTREAHGSFRSWHENGQLEAKGRFEGGRRVGVWTYFGPDGQRDAVRSGPVHGSTN